MFVKGKIFTRFLMRRWLGGFGIVVLTVASVIFAVTFVEKIQHMPTMLDAAWTSWILLLRYIPLFLPIAAFMGTLVCTYNMTRACENIIISGAGLSPYQSMRPFLIASFLIGVITITAINPYAVSVARGDIRGDHIEMTDNAVWLRETTEYGTFTLRATGLEITSNDIIVFTGATGFMLDAESKFIKRIESARLTLSDHSFRAPVAILFDENGVMSHTSDWNISSLMTPESVLERHLRPENVSFWQLPRFIQNLGNMGLNARAHQIQFFTLLFLPLTLIAMTVLGVAFSQTRERRNHSFGTKFSAGVLTCFAIYFIINIFGALGASGALPPLMAVLAPPLIVMLGAAIFIVSYDNI